MTIEELTKKLYICYSKDLCYSKLKNTWNENNKYCGMCAITALIVNDYFGGNICKTHVNGISHYFNLIDNNIVDLTAKQFQNEVKYLNYEIIKRDDILTDDTKYRYNTLKNNLENINNFNIKDLEEIDTNKMFLHYTNMSNLNNIYKKGLEPNIGINSKIIEKTKKVFFSIGDKGALVIMDSWLKWLIAKPKLNFIYWIGAYLLKFKFFPKFIHKIIITINQNNKNKYKWAYSKLNKILTNSVYLVLNLEENIDFSFNDIDEVKHLSNYPKSYISTLYAHDSNVNDVKIEYWNMHTFSDKIIEKEKISILKYKDNYSADKILKYLIEQNLTYVKENCELLYNYYNFVYKRQC